MAELEVRIHAVYDEVIDCRNELKKVEQEMKNLTVDSSSKDVQNLMERYNLLYQRWENGMERLGKFGAYARNAIGQVSDALEGNVELLNHLQSASSNMVETASRRAKAELDVNEALRKQRDELVARRDQQKALLESSKNDYDIAKSVIDGQPNATDADMDALKAFEENYNSMKKSWDEINDKIAVYDSMLETSETRLNKMANDLANVTAPFDGMDDNNALAQMRMDADTLIDAMTEAGNRVTQIQDELTANEGGFFKRLFAGSDDVEDTKQKVDDYGKAVEEAVGTANTAYKAQEAYVDALTQQMGEYEKKIAEASDPKEVERLTNQFANLKAEQLSALNVLESIKAVIEELDEDLEDAGKMKGTADRFAVLNEKLKKMKEFFTGSGAKEMEGDVSSLENEVKAAGDTFSNFYQKAQSDANSLKGSLKQLVGMVGIGFGIRELGQFAGHVRQMREYFQDIESSMKVFLGSAEKGTEFTKKLKDYAYYNMFEFADLAKASQEMISYGHNVQILGNLLFKESCRIIDVIWYAYSIACYIPVAVFGA